MYEIFIGTQGQVLQEASSELAFHLNKQDVTCCTAKSTPLYIVPTRVTTITPDFESVVVSLSMPTQDRAWIILVGENAQP